MTEPSSDTFDRAKVFRHVDSIGDPGAEAFDRDDLAWLLRFLESFRKLGWLPPTTPDQVAALSLNDFVVHARDGRTFFEFRVRGVKDDRRPTLTLFVHVQVSAGVVRILGNFRTDQAYGPHRERILDLMAARAGSIDRMLEKGRPNS